MSWTGGIFIFSEKTTEKQMMMEIRESLNEERGAREPVHQPLVLLEHLEVFKSYEDAEEYLESQKITREYHRFKNVGVRYLDYSDVKPTKKMEDIRRRITETAAKKIKYLEEHSVKTFKSQYIGCPGCGSKLSIKHLRGESCPLCRTDLRSATTLNTLKGYDDKIRDLNKALLEETKKNEKKAKVCWMVHADAYLG